jgi:hypothetical protein
MNDEIRQSVQQVQEALARVNHAFESYMEEVKAKGSSPSDILQIAKNADALKDSGNIYVSWARHYSGLGGDEASTDDIDEDEGRISGY